MLINCKNKKILILSPHPDDEIGCAGTLSHFEKNGAILHHYFFSLCTQSLEKLELDPNILIKECNRSRKNLNIKDENTGNFDFPVRMFNDYRQEILEELINLRKKILPDIIFVPSKNDIHQDHQVIYREAVRAFKHSTILGYELPWNLFQSQHNLFIKLDFSDLEKKLNIIDIYKSQLSRNYFSKDFFSSLAKVRGVQANTLYAESFEVIRFIA